MNTALHLCFGSGRSLGFFTMILFLLTSVHGQSDSNTGIGPFRQQRISLQAGWNAVYLEVEPRLNDPAELFKNTPIEIVAAYHRPLTSMQFLSDPSSILADRKSWNVWYAPKREDALLSNLNAIQAHQSYLIYTESAYVWNLQGTPFFGSARWHPNAFSLVGFPLDAAQLPTVAHFFSGAESQKPLRIYRMVSGQWSIISNPEQTMMQPGAAYWVFSKDASNFSGPLEVRFDSTSAGGLVFSPAVLTQSIEIRSNSIFPQNLTFSLLAGENGTIPLSYKVRVLELTTEDPDVSVALNQGASFGPLESKQAFSLVLEARPESLSQPVTATTLIISSSAGSRIEIPIIALRPDLVPQP